MANLDLLKQSREKQMARGFNERTPSATNPVVSTTPKTPYYGGLSQAPTGVDVYPSASKLAAMNDIDRKKNVFTPTKTETPKIEPRFTSDSLSTADRAATNAFSRDLRDLGLSQDRLVELTGAKDPLEALMLASGRAGLSAQDQALIDQNIAEARGQLLKDKEEERLKTEEERIREDVASIYAPEFTKARESGERTRETALRVQGRAAMGSKSEQEQQLINEKQQEIEQSIAAQQRLEERQQLALARGASQEEIDSINNQIQSAKDKRIAIQDELALQEAGLDQAAIEKSEFNTKMMLDALESGFEYDPASNSFTKMDEAMGPQKIDQGISKMLGYASDEFGNPITGADGNPLQISKDNDIEWGSYTDKYGNQVFFDKSNPTNTFNPGGTQVYTGSNGMPSSSQTSDTSGVTVLGQGEPYTRDGGGQGFLGENCVKFARENVPNLPFGLYNKQDKQKAIQMAAKEGFGGLGGMEAQVGDAILTGEGSVGHAAVVIGRDDATGELILGEANYSPGQITTGRRIAANDPAIYGYISSSKQPQMSSVINPSGTNEGLNPAVMSAVFSQTPEANSVEFTRMENKQFENWENSGFNPKELPEQFRSYEGEQEFKNQYAVWASQQDKKEAEKIKDLTAAELASRGFANRINQAEDIFNDLEESIANVSNLEFIKLRNTPDFLNSTKPEWFQRMEQAERNFINAVLRQESGAAIADSEFESASKQYFPQPGDAPSVIKQKSENRKIALQNLMRTGGYSDKEIEALKSSSNKDTGTISVKDTRAKSVKIPENIRNSGLKGPIQTIAAALDFNIDDALKQGTIEEIEEWLTTEGLKQLTK